MGISSKFDQLGWVVAAAIGGVMLASGFQGPTDKTGVVDIGSVVDKSNYGQANSAQFAAMKAARQGLLEFVDQNSVLTTEQAEQLHSLTVKDSPTDADKAAITKTEADVTASTKNYQALSGKTNLTPEEQTQLSEYSHRAEVMQQTQQRWYNEFMSSLQDWSDQKKLDSINKARNAVQTVAKAQGYTIVFDESVAPFGANDLTDAALQAMNAQK
jgi:Skp family chaperone for outer membrane proteins